MQIERLMTTNVRTCAPEDSLHRAAQLMWDADVGAIPVVDAEQRVQGIITDRDICMASYLQGGDLASHRVADAMSKDVCCCEQDDSVDAALASMRRRQVRRVPVVRGGRLVGMLSLNDIALAGGDARTARKGAPDRDDIAQTLASICEHRNLPAAMAAE